MLRRAVRLLAQLTRQVAIVQYPTLSTSSVRHLEVVALTPAKLLLVVITDSGRVDQRTVELGDAIDEHSWRSCANCSARRWRANRWPPLRSRCPIWPPISTAAAAWPTRSAGRPPCWWSRWSSTREERLLLGGTANLTRNTADFGGSLRSVLEALEEQVVVLRLLAAQQEAGKVTVRIGHETEAEEMAGTSVVTTTYGSSGKVFGGMGVLGPTRMDYPGTIANVAAVALYIGEVLGSR